jgi:hypothetical protein
MAAVVSLPVFIQVGSENEPSEIGWVEFEIGNDTVQSIRRAVADALRAAADALENTSEDDEGEDSDAAPE